MTEYTVATSANLFHKAAELDLLAMRADGSVHADVYQRLADMNRVAAAFAKIGETLDWRDAQAGVGKDACPMNHPSLSALA
ncbi:MULTISPECIES: hypothetical protein [unclassified Caulobacter]|uniref:hypothetical protein n=1 Tax=unclassified Caulobacter TaxID=2648921 RepID=UPI0004A74984|nr:hypothetical protein [Caulobacter sp. UNC358MFTsu5.1]